MSIHLIRDLWQNEGANEQTAIAIALQFPPTVYSNIKRHHGALLDFISKAFAQRVKARFTPLISLHHGMCRLEETICKRLYDCTDFQFDGAQTFKWSRASASLRIALLVDVGTKI